MIRQSGESPDPHPERRDLWKAFAASLCGTLLEYYDFALYSSASAFVFATKFFAPGDPLTGLFQSFATNGVGYVARPVGGIVFGRLGDVIGRKKVLVATLLLVGSATCLIGILPTYAQVGALAAALLATLRLVQGIGVGGEWGGAVLITSELSRESERGFWASAAQIGVPAGTLLATGVLGLLKMLPESSSTWWGWWRLAFLFSAVLVGFGLWIRTRLNETPAYRELESRGLRPRAPVTEVLRSQPLAIVAAILARVGPDVLYSMFVIFVYVYAPTALGMPSVLTTDQARVAQHEAVLAVVSGSALQLILVPVSGWLSDRWGRKRVYALGAVGGALWSIAFFAQSHTSASFVAGVTGALAFHALMYGPQAAFIAEQFPVHLRYTGSSLGYTLASVIGGATAPLVFTWLLAHHAPRLISVYIAAACALSLVGLALGRSPSQTKNL
jgi:MFS family permease